MSNDYIQMIKRVLRAHQISYRIEHQSKHPAVVGTHNGKNFVVSFPSTPSDVRGVRNFESNLRRAAGLVRAEKKASARRQERHRPRDNRWPLRVISRSEPAGPRTDRYYAPLQKIKEQLEANAGKLGASPPAPTPGTNELGADQSTVLLVVRLPGGWLAWVKDGNVSVGLRHEAFRFATETAALAYMATESMPQDLLRAAEIVPVNDNKRTGSHDE